MEEISIPKQLTSMEEIVPKELANMEVFVPKELTIVEEIIAITKEFPMKEDIAKESIVNHQRGEPPLLQHPERKHHRHHRCAVRRGVEHAFAVRRDVRHACRDSGGIINVSSRCSSSLLPRCPSFVPQGLLFRCFNHPHANSSVDSLFRITFLHRSMVNPND